MTVRRVDERTIALEGYCPVEEAETLRGLLLTTPAAEIDWRACEQAHAAVVQVLLASQKAPRGRPRSHFLDKLFEGRSG